MYQAGVLQLHYKTYKFKSVSKAVDNKEAGLSTNLIRLLLFIHNRLVQKKTSLEDSATHAHKHRHML